MHTCRVQGKQWLTALALLMALVAPNVAQAEEAGGKPFLFDAHVPLDPPVVAAVERAQAWLAQTQNADGGWNTSHGGQNCGEIAYAIMALMVNGSVPGEGKYSKEVGMGIQFLLNSQRENGLMAGSPSESAGKVQGPMYQHALATLVLAESYGMTSNTRIRTALIKAVNLIVDTQDVRGGWRYQPRPEQGDISVTVMQVMALRAAVEAGIHVPDETIARAIKFIYSCYNKNDKGFGYMNGGDRAGFARTGAGLVCLQTVGRYDDPIIPDIVKYLSVAAFDGNQNRNHYWYGQYYTSVGLYHFGGEAWKNYYPKITAGIVQNWEKDGHYGSVLDTSWAILILGVPYRYLPIYQR